MKTTWKEKLAGFIETPVGGILYLIFFAVMTDLIVICGQLIGMPLYLIADLIGNEMTESGSTLWGSVLVSGSMYAVFIGVWIVGILVMCRKKNRFMLKKLGYGGGNTFKNLLIGLLTGFGMNMFCNVLAMLHGDIHVYFYSFHLPAVLLLAVLVFIQSSAEEMVFRGYYFRKVLQRFGHPWAAILISGFLFGAVHISNEGSTVIGVLSCMLSGVLFAQMLVYFDSIWCAFGSHAAWNFTQNFLMGLPNSGIVVPYSIFKLDAANARDSFFYSTSFGPEGSMTSILVHVIGIVFLFYWFEIRKKKQAEN